MKTLRSPCLAMLAALGLAVAPCPALPTLSGGTGLVNVPTAETQSATAVHSEEGRIVTHLSRRLLGDVLELSYLKDASGDRVGGKVVLSRDQGLWPAIAIGVQPPRPAGRGASSPFVVLSKSASADLSLHLGVALDESSAPGLLGGLSLPWGSRTRFLGEYDGRDEAFNLGFEVDVTPSISTFTYSLGVFESGSSSPVQIYGVSYRQSF